MATTSKDTSRADSTKAYRYGHDRSVTIVSKADMSRIEGGYESVFHTETTRCDCRKNTGANPGEAQACTLRHVNAQLCAYAFPLWHSVQDVLLFHEIGLNQQVLCNHRETEWY